MKLTTQQLKRIIKEELDVVLDEALPAKEEWVAIMNDCIKSGKDHYDCIDLATQVFGRSWDDETIKKHLDYEYGNKHPEKLRPKKSETDEINAWIAQSAEDAYQKRNAAAIEAEKWEKLYTSFDWSQVGHMSNIWVADRYEKVFGKAPDSNQHAKRIKRKIIKWMNVHEAQKS
jgi:hypothetical protein